MECAPTQSCGEGKCEVGRLTLYISIDSVYTELDKARQKEIRDMPAAQYAGDGKRACRECNKSLRDFSRNARFCSNKHKARFNNRRVARGGIVYDLAMRWRLNREDTAALGELCHQLAMFADQDKLDGRKSWNDYTDQIIPYHIPRDEPTNGGSDGE